MAQSQKDRELMDRAFQDETVWRSAIETMRRKDPASCGDLLRYGATVKGWSDNPAKDLREAIRLFDKAGVSVEAAWCRVDLTSHIRKNSSEWELSLDKAYRAFEKAKDRDGMSSVFEAREKGEKLPEETDSTDGPALIMAAGTILALLSLAAMIIWENGPFDAWFAAGATGCLTGLGILIFGIYSMWKAIPE